MHAEWVAAGCHIWNVLDLRSCCDIPWEQFVCRADNRIGFFWGHFRCRGNRGNHSIILIIRGSSSNNVLLNDSSCFRHSGNRGRSNIILRGSYCFRHSCRSNLLLLRGGSNSNRLLLRGGSNSNRLLLRGGSNSNRLLFRGGNSGCHNLLLRGGSNSGCNNLLLRCGNSGCNNLLLRGGNSGDSSWSIDCT